MFGRLATDRIKLAEKALQEGRLDQAVEVLAGLDSSSLKKVKSFARQVITALMQRGQEYMLSRQFQLATADFDRAAQLNSDDDNINEWRQRARTAMHEEGRLRKAQAGAIKDAKNLMAAGEMSAAGQAVNEAPINDPEKQNLVAGIDARRDEARGSVESAKEALRGGEFDRAVAELNSAFLLHRNAPELADVLRDVVEKISENMRAAFASGQLHVARRHADLLNSLANKPGVCANMDEAFKIAQRASQAIHSDRFSEAEVLLGRLAAMQLNAAWIGDAREHIQSVQQHRRALLEGPLGLISGEAVPQGITLATNRPVARNVVINAAPPPIIRQDREAGIKHENGAIPRRFALRIDGVGTFLVLRGDRVSIGRAGSSGRPDLELISDLAERHAEIIRAGEDFFIASGGGVELAGRPVEHALLQHGDRIRLGSRVKLKFHRPSAKSVTGVLELGDGVRATCECRRVILWSGPLMLGSTRECHIPLPFGMEGVVLTDRSGQIWLKPLSNKEPARPVVMSGPIALGELRMSINTLEA